MIADMPGPDGAFEQIISPDAGVRFVFHGRCVDLLLCAALDEAPSRETLLVALRSVPSIRVDTAVLDEAIAASEAAEVRRCLGEVRILGTEPYAVIVSEDRLFTYLVPVEDAERRPLTSTTLRELLAMARVTTGLSEDVIAMFEEGAQPDTILCLARGTPAVQGTSARLEHHFDTAPLPIPTPRDDGSVDYHALLTQRFVEAGTVLVTRVPSVPGLAGIDVYGRALPVRAVQDHPLASLAGENTSVQGDCLVAAMTGQPVVRPNGAIEVLPVFEVKGDLDYHVGNIDFPGDVVIQGDMRPGFTIRAGGSVVVRGLVEGATIVAGADVSLTGVVGERRSVFEVGGNLRARYLHTSDVTVGGSAHVDREIVDCTVTAKVVSTGTSGRIVGGTINAETEVDAGILGGNEGNATSIHVSSRSGAAVVRARRAALPGLNLEIGGCRRIVNDEILGASFWDVGGTIVALAPSAEESAAA